MSYFLLLKAFQIILSEMGLLDGEGSPHSHKTEIEKLPWSETKDGLRGAGSKIPQLWRPDVLEALTWSSSLHSNDTCSFLGVGRDS